MRRKLTYGMVWAAATACAVTASWLAVRPVLHDAAFSRPSPVAISLEPISTQSPPPMDPKHAEEPPRSVKPSAPAKTRKPVPSGQAKTYKTIGGRATLIIGTSSASVFSAFPNEGYQVRTTTRPYELRVDFITATAKSSSVIVDWYNHPPKVELFEYRQET